MIEEFTSGMDFEEFRSNPMAVAAVERKLQIVSEAATRLGDEAEKRIPDQHWRDIRSIALRGAVIFAARRIQKLTLGRRNDPALDPLRKAL
jgi:uncharacterized protein with HEPN domain